MPSQKRFAQRTALRLEAARQFQAPDGVRVCRENECAGPLLEQASSLLRRVGGCKNLRYLLLKAQRMAVNKTEFVVFKKAA